MPLSPANASLIGSGVDLVGNVVNGLFQGAQNRKNRKFAEQMYDRQRSDALADRAFENEYNSPAAQMARLKKAGLNPNLVYDNGAAQSASVDTRNTNFSQPETRAPQFNTAGFNNSLMSYFDNQYKTAQTDNVAAMTDVAKAEVINKTLQALQISAQTSKIIAETGKLGVDTEAAKQALDQATQMMPVVLEQAKANVTKTNADTEYTLDQNDRAAAQNAMSLKEAAERILKSRSDRSKNEYEKAQIEQQIKNLQSDNTLKQLDASLKRMGVQPHDSAFQRALGELIQKLKGNVGEKMKDWFNSNKPDWKKIMQNFDGNSLQ